MGVEQGPAMIEAIGLCKYYGDFAAVENVSFSIPKGQVVAFLGPNGAGKSTTMKLLTGYLAPSKGSAKIAGPDMAPRSLLEFFADARGMSAKRKQERIDYVVDLCALGSVIGKAIGKLSKG